ncbi:Ribulosamine/erythrulosamine 3-kinase potentially involved in protein deglycation [hydrothermal vent metagenome]|uniref:Ribulosamine/erythrulosamine 3-kinase potentially involved in protein deglycation n=1 Tax=hydrothermal vent metagenome TaxID=652676 RepID=A0A3B1AE89_9ZZZZ
MSELWQEIERTISEATQSRFANSSQATVSGGCINQAYQVRDKNAVYFVKLNNANKLDMFEAEFEALNEIQQSNTVTVPRAVCTGVAQQSAFIVLEHLQLTVISKKGMSDLGQQLAAMHRTEQTQFGWTRDNTIGSTVQCNTLTANWHEFWQAQRLGFQLELAGHNGYRGALQKKGDKLMEKMSGLFSSSTIKASLLHGDLWSGNMAMLQSGSPVIFDPALYYGDRETDIAMTELFGGFSEDFYQSYNEHYPLDQNYTIRKTFYNSYHILNHLNLFGGGYGQQAESMIDQVLSELG